MFSVIQIAFLAVLLASSVACDNSETSMSDSTNDGGSPGNPSKVGQPGTPSENTPKQSSEPAIVIDPVQVKITELDATTADFLPSPAPSAEPVQEMLAMHQDDAPEEDVMDNSSPEEVASNAVLSPQEAQEPAIEDSISPTPLATPIESPVEPNLSQPLQVIEISFEPIAVATEPSINSNVTPSATPLDEFAGCVDITNLSKAASKEVQADCKTKSRQPSKVVKKMKILSRYVWRLKAGEKIVRVSLLRDGNVIELKFDQDVLIKSEEVDFKVLLQAQDKIKLMVTKKLK